MISNLKLNIIDYKTYITVVILLIRFFVVARVSIHADLSVDDRIHAVSLLFLSSRGLRIGVHLLLVITILKLQVRTAR